MKKLYAALLTLALAPGCIVQVNGRDYICSRDYPGTPPCLELTPPAGVCGLQRCAR